MVHLISCRESEHDWKTLFGTYSAIKGEYPSPQKVGPPKYHELPIAMQFGIFLEWAYPYQWTEAEKPGGFFDSAERGIHHILRFKESRL